jgi:IS4 transposase
VVVDEAKKERIELWDTPKLETLSSFDGEVRVVRGEVHDLNRPESEKHTWCALVTGKPMRLSPEKIVSIARRRWQIENAFHQWTTLWHFTHVFIFDGHAIQALFGLFFAAFNLLTFFLYLQVKSYGRDRGKDVTRTISRFIDECLDDLPCLTASVWNTS